MRGRLLTVRQLQQASACQDGLDIFRRYWGNQVLVTDEWATQAARYFGHLDCLWVSGGCRRALPRSVPVLSSWAYNRLVQASNNYLHGRHAQFGYYGRVRFVWAYFASIYVDDGLISRM